MKKLIKFLLVIGLVLFTAFAAGSSVFAEGELPEEPKQEEVLAEGINEMPVEEGSQEVVEAPMVIPENSDHILIPEDVEVPKDPTDTDALVDDNPDKPVNDDAIKDKDIDTHTYIHDTENPDREGTTIVEETILEETGSKTIEDNSDWKLLPLPHYEEDYDLLVNPDDILLEIDPKFTEEVAGVFAIRKDDTSIFENIFNAIQHKYLFEKIEDSQIKKFNIVNSKNEDEGKWVIETPTIKYDIYHNQYGYYIKQFNNKGDYDDIYIYIQTKDMGIDDGVRDNDGEGGLDLVQPEIELSVDTTGSEDVTIFDAGNLEQYVKDYTDTYKDTNNEGLTFENIRYEVVGEKGTTTNLNVENKGGEIKASAIGEGEFDVLLTGWYTQKLWESTRLNDREIKQLLKLVDNKNKKEKKIVEYEGIKYSFDYEPEGSEEYKEWEYIKEQSHYEWFGPIRRKVVDVEAHWEEVTKQRIIPASLSNLNKLEINNGWATFAKISVKAIETLSPIYVDGSEDEWIVTKPTEYDPTNIEDPTKGLTDEQKEDLNVIVIEAGNNKKIVGLFEINLYQQKEEAGKKQPIEQLHSLDGKNASITVEVKGVGSEVGKHPEFTVYVRHKLVDDEVAPEGSIVKDGYAIITINPTNWVQTAEGIWNVTFDADKFSTYAVGYELVNNPAPHHHSSSDGYQFVNTGVTETVQTVDYTGYILLVAGMALVVVALRKRLAD